MFPIYYYSLLVVTLVISCNHGVALLNRFFQLLTRSFSITHTIFPIYYCSLLVVTLYSSLLVSLHYQGVTVGYRIYYVSDVLLAVTLVFSYY